MPTEMKVLFIMLLVGVTFLVALVLGSYIQAMGAQKAAIQHNAAHYDNKTGKFMWNDEIIPGVTIPQSH